MGIREIAVRDGVVELNGTPITFRGVNRHDSDPVTGSTISREQALKDLQLMKEHNINAIRTSHYPNAPWFPQLCSELGFYVIGEADLETHGVCTVLNGRFSTIARDPMFHDAILDRVQRDVIRDKNNACIVMWSLGNESGYGQNMVDAAKWVKSYDPTRLVHYESVGYDPSDAEYDQSCLDLKSRMYASPAEIDAYFADPSNKKPFIQCEYVHSMGNGPGDIEDYVQQMMKYPGFCGGFAWEWCDHAVYMGRTPDNREKYAYGGDFGEFPHDGNFCMDGLVYPDRTPHTGALEMTEVYRPLRAVKMDATTYKFINTNRFRPSDYIQVNWVLCENGKPIKSGSLTTDIPPRGEALVQIPAEIKNRERDYILNFTYEDINSGEVIAHEQFIINDVPLKYQIDKSKKALLTEQNDCYVITSPDCTLVFSQETGALESYKVKGREMLNIAPISENYGFLPNIHRAPIDNESVEVKMVKLRKKTGQMQPRFTGIAAKEVNDHIAVSVRYAYAPGFFPWYVCKMEYSVYPDGTIKVEAELERSFFGQKDLPRFGVVLELPRAFSNVYYYGRGVAENLPDMNAQAPVGIYESTVPEMHENYIKPQDNGNHGGTKYLRLTDTTGTGLQFFSASKFSFSVHNYTQDLLCKAKHREDVYPQNTTFVSIDGFVRGAGTASCGPDTLEKYRIPFQAPLKFEFAVQPVLGGDEK